MGPQTVEALRSALPGQAGGLPILSDAGNMSNAHATYLG